MKYFKIVNKGLLDPRLVSLMGGSTKSDDPSKIGQFGTGLKYAISWLVRNEVKFHLFSGEKEIVFTAKDENISGKEFKEIYCNGQSMNITTHYGYQWKGWEALREIYCNSIDETGSAKGKVNPQDVQAITGSTVFYIECTKEINEVLKNWNTYFFKGEPLFEDNTVAIYPNSGEQLKIYKRGVLIHESTYYKSLFLYDIKEAPLNELRQFQGYMSGDIAKALLRSNKNVINLLLAAIKDEKSKDLFEVKLDWSYTPHDKVHVKDIFHGHIYLHPQSDTGSDKSVKVNQSLFDLLNNAGLPTEKIKKGSGGLFGGSGVGHRDETISYKEITNTGLQKRIQAFLTKYGSAMKYSIAIHKNETFDFLVNKDIVIFCSDLERLSDADLEASILISILAHQEESIYKAFKRLIKYSTSHRDFKKMLFGRNILDKVKPTYQPPVINEDEKVLDDEWLPF